MTFISLIEKSFNEINKKYLKGQKYKRHKK